MNADEAIALARKHEAKVTSARPWERRPNRFRLFDAGGKVLGASRIADIVPSRTMTSLRKVSIDPDLGAMRREPST